MINWLRTPAVFNCPAALYPAGRMTPRDLIRLYLQLRAANPDFAPPMQISIDQMLQSVLDGKDPRLVFSDAIHPGKSGMNDPIKELPACAEYYRLTAPKASNPEKMLGSVAPTHRDYKSVCAAKEFFETAFPEMNENSAKALISEMFDVTRETLNNWLTKHGPSFYDHMVKDEASLQRRIEAPMHQEFFSISTYTHNLAVIVGHINAGTPHHVALNVHRTYTLQKDQLGLSVVTYSDKHVKGK